MKKIWKEINRRVYVYWYMGLSTLLAIGVSFDDNFNWWEAAIFGLIFFTLFTGLAYMNHVQEEKQAKYNDERFADDVDWKKYKDLKKKFNNR